MVSPHNIKDKIMQPFFTTKPTGRRTGVGTFVNAMIKCVIKDTGGNIDVKNMR